MENPLDLINKVLQEVSAELKARNVEMETQDLIEEIAFLEWVKAMENEYSAYSYCEE
jgi:cell division protein FtsB